MSITTSLEKSFVDVKSPEAEALRIVHEAGLSVVVVFTSANQTLKALEQALVLARRLGAGVEVVAVQIVPFPLPLDRPPVPFEFIMKRFAALIDQGAEKTSISVYLCRDQLIALKRVLKPNSLVVMGTRKRWWPTREERVARKLRRAGHDVILVETE